jgi:lipopolysaccharide heptosyltransferase II
MINFKKVLIIQTAFPGDAVLTLPLIQYLKNEKQVESVDVFCIPETREIFVASNYVNDVIVIDKKKKQQSLLSLFKISKALRKNSYDAIYTPHRSFRSALITLLTGVKETFGFDNSSLSYAFRNIIHYNILDHEVKRNLLLAGDEFENEKWKILPELNETEEIKNQVKEFINENGLNEKFITIAPASVWGTKQYPADQFKEVITLLSELRNKIVLIGSAKDYELCQQLAINENIINSAGRFSIVASAALLSHSKLLIANDSLPSHLGMCADIPVLMIYCSTVPEFGFYPYNNKSAYLSYNDLKCKPCGIHGYPVCPIGTFECAKKLEPKLVVEKAKELMS